MVNKGVCNENENLDVKKSLPYKTEGKWQHWKRIALEIIFKKVVCLIVYECVLPKSIYRISRPDVAVCNVLNDSNYVRHDTSTFNTTSATMMCNYSYPLLAIIVMTLNVQSSKVEVHGSASPHSFEGDGMCL